MHPGGVRRGFQKCEVNRKSSSSAAGSPAAAVLYHLTKLGWTDVMLVERSELTSGSTWHAAGLCTQMISSWNLMKVLQYSLKLYELDRGRDRAGGRLPPVREFADRRRHKIASTSFTTARESPRHSGIPFEVITRPDRARELHPARQLRRRQGDRPHSHRRLRRFGRRRDPRARKGSHVGRRRDQPQHQRDRRSSAIRRRLDRPDQQG